MPHLATRLIALFVLSTFLTACEKQQGNRKQTFPVKGKVLVDGQPVPNLAVRCYNVAGMDKDNPTMSSCFTVQDGSFQIATYEQGDGVPEGDYVLTFQWGELNLFTKSYDGDKLNGRYSEPEKSEIKFSVKTGQPTDLGDINLTTK